MSGISRPRPGGSRSPVGRPRKVAGRRPEPAAATPAVDAPVLEEDAPAPTVVEEDAPAPTAVEEDAPAPTVVEEAAPPPTVVDEQAPSGRAGRRTSWILVSVIAVLALVGVGEIVYLARDPEPTVSAARPVVTGDVSQRAAVESAARSTEQILSTSYQDYDGQVDKASEKMTDTFAKQYRELQGGIEDKFVALKTKLTVKAVAQGVVQASPQQVQALLFLNQYVEKVEDGRPKTSFAQYRALVTVVKTDQGWLVSNIETK